MYWAKKYGALHIITSKPKKRSLEATLFRDFDLDGDSIR
jgi:hypothetical protein